MDIPADHRRYHRPVARPDEVKQQVIRLVREKLLVDNAEEEVPMNAYFISNQREMTNDESIDSVQYIGVDFTEILDIANLTKRMASIEHDVARLKHNQDQVSIRNLLEQGRMVLWKKHGQQFLQAKPDSLMSYETFDKVTRSRYAVFKPKFWTEFILYVKEERWALTIWKEVKRVNTQPFHKAFIT
jgi:hypothetical protein